MAQFLPLLAFAQTADATSRELLLRWNPFFRRIHGNSFRARLRQLLGLTVADQSPEFRGKQYSKLVIHPISQRLPPQLRSPWAEWHKKDGAGQWAVVVDMPTRPLNTPHVVLDILHQIYPYVLWWAADLVATPQQKFPVGSPANVKICKVPAEQAPRVLEASTLLIREEEMVGQVMDLASPPWAPASILALHLASGLRDPMSMCSPHDLLRTPRLPELSLAVWAAAGEVDTHAGLGGFLVDDAFSPLPTNSAARTTKEVPDKLVDGDCVPIDPLPQFEAAVQPGATGKEEAQLRQLSDQHGRTCETLQATEDALLSARQDLVHQKKLHSSTTERLQSRIDDLQVWVTNLVQTLDRKRAAAEGPGAVDTRIQPAVKTLLSLARKLPPQGHAGARHSAVGFGQTTHGLTNITRHGIRLCQFF